LNPSDRGAFFQSDAKATYNFSAAQMLLAEGDYQGAIDHLVQSLESDPTSSYLHRELAMTLAMAGKLDEAEKYAKMALDLSPEDPQGYTLLGLLYLQTNRASLAEETFKSGMKQSPDDPNLVYRPGRGAHGPGQKRRSGLHYGELPGPLPRGHGYKVLLRRDFPQRRTGRTAEAQFKRIIEYDPPFTRPCGSSRTSP